MGDFTNMDSTGKEFRILSIDGGGIKGLLTASFFDTLEKRLNKNIADFFDLIVGTSTGGIITLALADRISANEIVNFYLKFGPSIFKKRVISKFIGKGYGLFKSLYDIKPLKTALQEVFKEKTLQEMYEENKVAVCVTATNPRNCKPYVFKTPHQTDLKRHLKIKLWEVALSTSAAPIFFPIVSLDSNYLVDGGLWANNPSMVALTEALGPYFKKCIDEVSILSVGNISSCSALQSYQNLEKGLVGWRQNIITLTLDAQSAHAHFSMVQIFQRNERQYYRIEDKVKDPYQLKILSQLDNATEDNLKHLIERGEQLACEFVVKDICKYYFNHKEG